MPPPRVSGVIDGSMTISQEIDGTLSFRVIIDNGPGRDTEPDLLELIISPEYLGPLNRTLADHGTKASRDPVLLASFPCRIGFRSMTMKLPQTAA